MSTADSPWDEAADLPDADYRSVYGAEAEWRRFLARVAALERAYARTADATLALLRRTQASPCGHKNSP